MHLAFAPARPRRQRGAVALAGVLLAAEGWFFTWGRNSLGDYASGLVLTLCGLAAGVFVYWLSRGQPWPLPARQVPVRAGSGVAVGLAAALGAVVCAITQARLLPRFVVSVAYSDIIPALHIYCRRFLAGEVVYRPLTDELGYVALPTYLPATWGPYLLPEMLHFDYRWMAFGLLLAGLGSYLWLVWRLRRGPAASAGLALLPFFLVYALQRTDQPMFGATVEPMIIGYYFVLLSGLLLGRRVLVVLGLLLCLLSRYALVLWVPLLLGLLWAQESPRRALWTAGLVGGGVVALYLVPFLSADWSLFGRVQAAYEVVAVAEWQHLESAGRPYHLYNGIGLGNLVYHYGSGTLLEKIRLLKKIHFAALGLAVLGAALLYRQEAPPRTDYRVFGVLALKFYLVLFYALVQIPYSYLASVSLLTSCFLVLVLVQMAAPASFAGEKDADAALNEE